MSFFSDRSMGPRVFAAVPDAEAMRLIAGVIFIERYTKQARVQYERLQTFFALDPESPGWLDRLDQACGDVHMYFISWRQVNAMMTAVVRASVRAEALAPVRQLYSRSHSKLKVYNEARDTLEHLDERIPGGRKVDTLVDRGNMGAFSVDHLWFSFGGLEWDISEASILMLESTVGEFLDTLRTSLGATSPTASDKSPGPSLTIVDHPG